MFTYSIYFLIKKKHSICCKETLYLLWQSEATKEVQIHMLDKKKTVKTSVATLIVLLPTLVEFVYNYG